MVRAKFCKNLNRVRHFSVDETRSIASHLAGLLDDCCRHREPDQGECRVQGTSSGNFFIFYMPPPASNRKADKPQTYLALEVFVKPNCSVFLPVWRYCAHQKASQMTKLLYLSL